MLLQTEILSTETSDFLKQIIFLKSFNSAFFMIWRKCHSAVPVHLYIFLYSPILSVRLQIINLANKNTFTIHHCYASDIIFSENLKFIIRNIYEGIFL